MDDSNNIICRLCLEVTPVFECDSIEAIEREIQEDLQINIDLSISDYAVACKSCLERLQNCFELTSRCYTAFMNNTEEVFHRESKSNDNEYLESSRACQLCTSLINDEDFKHSTGLKDGVLLKDMIRKCLPKLDLTIVHESLICKLCLSSLKAYYEFMKNCQEVEQRIEHFREVADHGTAGKVNLEDMLEFKDCNMPWQTPLIKKEDPDVEEAHVDVINSLKNEEIACIKCEEIDVKDELDNETETSASDQESFGKNDFLKIKTNFSKRESIGKNYFCPKCPYSARSKFHITRHMRSNKLRKCYVCPFITDKGCLLATHMKIHRGPTLEFGCRECHYETDIKLNLVKHMIKHKDTSQVQMHKCPLCPFESKYKSATVKHQKLQHDMNIKMYNCKNCSFSTKHKVSFEGHQLMHKNPDEILMYKCEKCVYKTKYKSALSRHMLSHDKRAVASKFKYDKCPYRTKSQGDRKMQHNTNIKMYNCKECPFSTKHKVSFEGHQLVHKNPDEIPMYKCEKCVYKTKYKSSLSRHMLSHDKREVANKFKCDKCPYGTKSRSDLKIHLAVHSDKRPFSCAHCDCSFKRRWHLTQHTRSHEQDRELDHSKQPTFKCEQCKYGTRQIQYLIKHQAKHMKLEERLPNM